jgi:hypothetical protein
MIDGGLKPLTMSETASDMSHPVTATRRAPLLRALLVGTERTAVDKAKIVGPPTSPSVAMSRGTKCGPVREVPEKQR